MIIILRKKSEQNFTRGSNENMSNGFLFAQEV